MSLNEVQSHFHGKATEDMGTILGTLMEVVKNSNIKLTKEQKDILSNKKDDVKLSSKSVVEIYRTRLKEVWVAYREPTERKAQCQTAYNKWVKEQRIAFRSAKETRNEEATEERKEKAKEDEAQFIDNLLEPVKEEGDICYGLDLRTMTIDYKKPLQYTGQIKLELINDCVMISPLSKIVDINKTLRKILIKGAEYGWTREHIATLLKLFTKEYLSVNYTCLAYLEDPTEIWEAVSNLIDFSSAESTILQAMKGLVRKKNHGIVTVVGAFKSLAFDLHEIKSPYSTKDDCLKEADKDAVKICKWFIEPNLHALLKGITDKIKYEDKRKVNLAEYVDLVNKYEMSSQYRLKSDKTLDRFDISQVSIFLCDPEIIGLGAGNGTEGVYTAQGESIYESIPGTPSTIRKDSHYGSNSSLNSTGEAKKREEHRGRSITKRSPFTERKRLYLNRGGERRSFSRNRIETYDEKTGKFVPRPLSRSKDRRGRSGSTDKHCVLCNSPHGGTCHWYGKIKPTKEECSNCGGRHHKSICLGKRSLTPGGTRRSPSEAGRSKSRDSEKEKDKKGGDWFPRFKGNDKSQI